MQTVDVYKYHVITDPSRFGHSNSHLYATSLLALDAANRHCNPSALSILVFQCLATLPDEQIAQLQNQDGLTWDANIDSETIKLKQIRETEHPVSTQTRNQ